MAWEFAGVVIVFGTTKQKQIQERMDVAVPKRANPGKELRSILSQTIPLSSLPLARAILGFRLVFFIALPGNYWSSQMVSHPSVNQG